MKKEPKKSVARIPERKDASESRVKGSVGVWLSWTRSLTCAGSHPHDGIKAYDFLNISPQVVEEPLLVRLSLGWTNMPSLRQFHRLIIRTTIILSHLEIGVFIDGPPGGDRNHP